MSPGVSSSVESWTRRSCLFSTSRTPWFLSVARGQVRLYLSEHKGDARPDTLIHLYVRDIDAVSEEFQIPVDEEGLAGQECDLVDPDGNRLRIATRRSG